MSGPVFLVCPWIGFPEGMASTARVRLYAKAFRDAGHDVTVVCHGWSETADVSPPRNTEVFGASEGITFWYPSGSTCRPSSFLRRRLRALLSWGRIMRTLVPHRSAAILTYPMTPTIALLLLPLSRLTHARVICDQSELPETHSGAGFLGRVRLAFRVWGLRHSDGILAITPTIVDHLRSMDISCRILHVPVLIDHADYTAYSEGTGQTDIVYAGSLDDEKDGVGTLLQAFARVKTTHPGSRLVLVGDANPTHIGLYRARAEELRVGDAVVFRGKVSRSELLGLLGFAAVLVLPRPDTEQNRANMPTKLVEYLATGRPVVATSVGMVTQMIEDGFEATLVRPGDPAALAAGLRLALDDPAGAADMAKRGRRRVLAAYDYRAYTARLEDFVSGSRRPRT